MTTDLSSLLLHAGEGETIFQATGEFWIWKATAETNGGQYDQAELILLPQAASQQHYHRQDELFYFLEGTIRMMIEEHFFTVSPGAFVRVPAGMRHAWLNLGSTAGKALLTYIPGGMKGMFDEVTALYLAPTLDRQKLAEIAATYGTIVTGPPLTK